MLKISLLALFIAFIPSSWAAETCSRVAIINYQEVLIDTNTTQKGEGLRYHLEKDPKALGYLDRYQEGNGIRWQNAVLGTAGTGLILGGLISNGSKKNKQNLLIGGVTLILINFLASRTLDTSNETNLINAVEEYNKRNLPRIYFNPIENERGPSSDFEFSLSKGWNF
ncbi:MAG: hypothetical protein HN509_03015 [Halobacteriovoraceae bacterium]|jgi:hypothetical protein|nr:hypothetical protein [Halobacteriovoraceae bacterium]MBT5095177.1 hypothetical protein [Halobacteriovoraceae bacterium]